MLLTYSRPAQELHVRRQLDLQPLLRDLINARCHIYTQHDTVTQPQKTGTPHLQCQHVAWTQCHSYTCRQSAFPFTLWVLGFFPELLYQLQKSLVGATTTALVCRLPWYSVIAVVNIIACEHTGFTRAADEPQQLV